MSKAVTNYTVKRIIALNEEREGGSTAEFTRKLGLTQNNYHSWIHRDAPPKAETLGKMCEIYSVAPEWFFEGDDPLIQRIRAAIEKRPAKNRDLLLPRTTSNSVSELKNEIDALKKEKERLLRLVESQQETIRDMAAGGKKNEKHGAVDISASYNLK